MSKVANRLSTERLRELARAGATEALQQLRAEIIAIERTFPELKLPHAAGHSDGPSLRRLGVLGECRLPHAELSPSA